MTKETQQDPFLRRLARALQEWLYTVQGRDHELQQPNDEEKATFWMDQAVQFSNGLADHDLSLVDEPPEGEAQASSEALEQALQTIREREPDEPAAEPGTAEVTPMVPVDSVYLSGSLVLSTGIEVLVTVRLDVPKLTRPEDKELESFRVTLHDLTPCEAPDSEGWRSACLAAIDALRWVAYEQMVRSSDTVSGRKKTKVQP